MTEINLKRYVYYGLGIGAVALLGVAGAAAQISLSSTVALALQNSTQVKIASADVQRANAGISEAKDVYIPNLVTGASPGPPSIGFPLGQPSLFNVQSQSLVYSFSQPDYIRAARAALKSAQLSLKDNQDQVTLDCALAYIQLDTDTRKLASLDEEKSAAEKLVSIERDRLNAGVDSRMDETKAEITSAQIDINRLHTEDDVSDQRQKLAHLTGLPAASFISNAKSIPPAPDFAGDDTLSDQAIASNSGVQAAYANAKSKLDLSFGDEKQNYRPQFSFGTEYSRFASFNNYSEYYLHFRNDNFGAAVQITLPLFDASRRAKARESAAEARRAQIEADQAKNQTSEQAISLRHSLAELKEQQHLAQLQSDYAQEQLETVRAELKNGTGSLTTTPVTPKDEQLASIQVQERYQDVLNANLVLLRAQLSLMRSVGSIGDWVNSAVK
ncbi:MAG: TolC family protein [Silvibacterium sp.]